MSLVRWKCWSAPCAGRTLIELPFEPNLWQAQNIWYEILRTPATRSPLYLPTTGPLGEKLQPARTYLSIDTEAIRATTKPPQPSSINESSCNHRTGAPSSCFFAGREGKAES